jgi:hypothetical protein
LVGGLIGLFLLSVVLLGAISGGRPNPGPSSSPGGYPGVGDTASGGQGQPVDGITCAKEILTYHVHAHLAIIRDGQQVPVAGYVGIPGGEVGVARCFYWLHTHDASGIIHLEAPAPQTFTLGQFFDIWGMPLGRNGVANYDVPNGDITAFVDGQQYAGDPRDIELKAHTQIVLELGQSGPPPPYTFPAGA